MLAWLTARRVRRVFARLGERDVGTALAGLHPRVHHRFAGRHPLGGDRHDVDAVRRWFDRLFRLFPGLTFTVHDVAVAGRPWRQTVTVQWSADVRPLTGEPYVNHGAHVLQVRWGRVVHLHAYEDSQAVAEACARMAADGIAEAAEPPIES